MVEQEVVKASETKATVVAKQNIGPPFPEGAFDLPAAFIANHSVEGLSERIQRLCLASVPLSVSVSRPK